MRVVASPIRCPFCHEGIDLADEAWVACAGCVARHHHACWDEAGRCGSCGGGERLTRDGGQSQPPAGRLRLLTRRPEDDLRDAPNHPLFGGPMHVVLERTFEGELDLAEEAPWLAGEVRRVMKTKGHAELQGRAALRWVPSQGQDGCNQSPGMELTLSSHNGRTTLRVEERLANLLGGTLGAVVGGLGGGLSLFPALGWKWLMGGSGLNPDSLTVGLMLVIAGWFLCTAFLARWIFARSARRRPPKLEQLVERLSAQLAPSPPAASGLQKS